MANRLAAETSPYLLQHAHNPVDWYPWGDEALSRATKTQRPIFLSVGYAACHWCHVMERESFEDEGTAALLNDAFVAIKVDREERPDVDAIYMDAVQHMTGQGGWPMSVFLTPDGKPFYAGTYFPDTPRHGLPSFRQVLEAITQAWNEQRPEIVAAAERTAVAVATAMNAPINVNTAAGGVPADEALAALEALEANFDAHYGGWGRAPKFPQPLTIEFLLRAHLRSGDERPLAMARRTLDAMADGGIYDQLGGGFARYSTDERWLVPHFEKMLYDNALLARVYVHAWQVTGDERYRRVAEQTLEFARRELMTADGGFAASLDADTDGVEGGTYVWAKAQVDELLGSDAPSFERFYGVTADGNWEGVNILHRAADETIPAEAAEDGRRVLFAARQQRSQPARDDKVLTSWNGLIIGALADAATAFADDRWARPAEQAADLLLTRVRDADGRLRRSFKDGRARHSAVLDDYAHLADGLLALYEATFDDRWFVAARGLADEMLDHFTDPVGGFFDTADDHEKLLARPKGLQDSPLPSGNATAVEVLLRLAALTGEDRYRRAADDALGLIGSLPARYPTAFAQWLTAGLLARDGVAEIAIAGGRDAPDTRAMLAVVRSAYRPAAVVAVGRSESAVPLLLDRSLIDERATAYVCRNFVCRQPVTTPADLGAQL
jgi:uncharacterized protein YyaL (SSP411 family)